MALAKTIGSAIAKEFTSTPVRSTAAAVTSGFFTGVGVKQLRDAAKDTGNTGVRIEKVSHPSPTK